VPQEDMATAIRTALADPAVRAEIAALLIGQQDARERHLGQLAAELAQFELTWQRRKDGRRDRRGDATRA
jgi:hypothetical protein